MSHRPVCAKCGVELFPKKNGVGCLDYSYFGEGEEEKSEQYQIWDADLWECPCCHLQIVTGFGLEPISNHDDKSFSVIVKNYREKSVLIHNRTR